MRERERERERESFNPPINYNLMEHIEFLVVKLVDKQWIVQMSPPN